MKHNILMETIKKAGLPEHFLDCVIESMDDEDFKYMITFFKEMADDELDESVMWVTALSVDVQNSLDYIHKKFESSMKKADRCNKYNVLLGFIGALLFHPDCPICYANKKLRLFGQALSKLLEGVNEDFMRGYIDGIQTSNNEYLFSFSGEKLIYAIIKEWFIIFGSEGYCYSKCY